MNSLRVCLLLFLLTCLTGAGCSRQIVESDNPIMVDTGQYGDYFDTTIELLRDEGYVIDRRDYRFGTITTLPQGSPNVFEVWNDQNTTVDQAFASTLASEQRRVNVRFAKQEELDNTGSDPVSGDYSFEVQVILERKQVTTRRMAGSARRNVFSDLAAPPRKLQEQGVESSYWEPVGRDTLLEARLMQQIRERVALSQR